MRAKKSIDYSRREKTIIIYRNRIVYWYSHPNFALAKAKETTKLLNVGQSDAKQPKVLKEEQISEKETRLAQEQENELKEEFEQEA